MNKPKRVVVLDGGTGTSLANLGHAVEDLTWCSALTRTHPQDVKKVHKDYFLAGADVVCTATYQAFIEGFVKQFGVSEQEAAGYIRKGVELATEARDEVEAETGRHCFVAASIGPYGAALCDRSEYTGAYIDSMPTKELYAWHMSRLKILKHAKADIIACETIPALKEAMALVQCLKDLDMQAWLTFTLKDGKTIVNGDDVAVALKAIASSNCIVAVGVNCFSLAVVDDFLNYVSDVPLLGKPLIIKPNAEMSESDRSLFQKFKLHERVVDWVLAGACWVGGCCSTDCSDIAKIRKELEKDARISFMKNGERLF